MKIAPLIIFLLFLPLLATPQKITVSEDLTLRNDVSYELLGELGGRLLIFRDQTNEFVVQAFDQNLRKVWKKDIELDKRQPNVMAVTFGDDYFALVYRFRRGGNHYLKAHKYDPAANLVDSVTIKDYGFQFYTPNYQTVVSEDRSKVMVYYVEKQSIFHALVFDLTTMSLLWEKTFSLDDFNYWENFQQMVLGDDGGMNLILSKNNFSTRKDVHYYEIHSYYGTGEVTGYNLPLKGFLTYDVLFTWDNLNQNLVAGGFYAEKNNGRASGYFYLSMPRAAPDDHLLQFHPFEDEFVSVLEGKEVNNNKGISELQVQELVLRRDGGLLMVTERLRQTERQLAGNRISYNVRVGMITDFYYDEICLFSLHPTGEAHWQNILHKKQYSQDDGAVYSSYFLFKSPAALRFLFNDEIRYENTVSEYVINGLGNYDRNSLLSTENLKLRLRFRDALQTGADKLIVPSERRNRLRLVRMEY